MTFDASGKIASIRQQWDQGSLLKQLDIIGMSGRNWPIRDSREQLALIQSCLKSSGAAPPKAESHNDVVIRTRGASNNAMRDPHASLQLFGDREELERAETRSVVSPYAGGHRSGQRSFADILGDNPTGEHYDAGHSRHRSTSPSKAGQGKNVQPMRIFEGQEHHEEEETPKGKTSSYIRPNPAKYDHFDFADGSDPQDQPQRGVSYDERPKSKHDSQWSFDDFATPHKSQPSKSFRPQEVRHWGTEAPEADVATKPAGKGRRDAETHFELQDDGEKLPHQERASARPRGSMHNDGLGLYKNKLFEQDGASAEPERALGNITNLKDRGKDFDAHFAMSDESPAGESSRQQHVPEGRKKAVKMMDANWSSYDKSPTSQKENQSDTRGEGKFLDDNKINIAGDGMGGRKGTNRDWLYGGGGEEEVIKPKGGRRTNPAAAHKSFWDH